MNIIIDLLTPLLITIPLLGYFSKLQRDLARSIHPTFYKILLVPGTAIHESSHALACLLCGLQIKKITFWSGKYAGELGAVEFSYNPNKATHWIFLSVVGLAPLIGGIATYNLVAHFAGTALLPTVHQSLQLTDSTSRLLFREALKAAWLNWEIAPTMAISLIPCIAVIPFSFPSLIDLKLAWKGCVIAVLVLMMSVTAATLFNHTAPLNTLLYALQGLIITQLIAMICLSLMITIGLLTLATIKRLIK
ncbi:hypothetical protein [Enterovibrio paralichthyis]|uniref:hypothetical protein n=1 Tax=Enterovibrio paralichthyis TaxID=2853805 RepID=UPI001C46522C|nr:hypothetical protein [Enterovibrio paralichthyis]MBV7300259.1 hypothetical protein [Enterovibrio paralichthyis]